MRDDQVKYLDYFKPFRNAILKLIIIEAQGVYLFKLFSYTWLLRT